MVLRYFVLFGLGFSACGKGYAAGADTAGAEDALDMCLAADVCAVYSSEWGAADIEAHCNDMGGAFESCPTGELGACALDNGLTYRLYEMPQTEAQDYCGWFGGTWTTSE